MAKPPKASASFRLSQSTQAMLKNFADEKQLNKTDVVEMAIHWFIQEAQNKPELLRLPLFATSTLSDYENNISAKINADQDSNADEQLFDSFEEEQKRLIAEGKEKQTDLASILKKIQKPNV